jgi:ketosteroid isomerase-like protein
VKHVFWILLLSSLAHGAPCAAGHAQMRAQMKDGDALIQLEQAWARALEQRDTATLACILADEFQDFDIDGKVIDKDATLTKAKNHRAVHHELSDLTTHMHGDFAYIRGVATATDEQTKMVMKVRFTDIYVYREERWQCVAGQESLISAMSH